MAKTSVYKNVKLFHGGYDLSCDSNQLTLTRAYDEVEAKNFCQEAHYAVPGLAKSSYSFQGNSYSNDDPAGVEDVLDAALGQGDVPMTFCPGGGGAAGTVGYFIKALELALEQGGSIGEIYAFTASGVGENVPLVRGTMLENGIKTSTGTGTSRELGAVADDRQLFACLHVLEVGGTLPTLNLIIESDDAEGFASPVARASFAQASAIGAQYLTPVDGPITDTWWRAKWTLGGTDPEFTFALVMGIR